VSAPEVQGAALNASRGSAYPSDNNARLRASKEPLTGKPLMNKIRRHCSLLNMHAVYVGGTDHVHANKVVIISGMQAQVFACPADAMEWLESFEAWAASAGPSCFRCGRAGE